SDGLAHGLRLEAVQVRLPNVLWFIIITGALISLSLSFFFRVEDVWLQGIQVSLLAAFIGMAIFLIFAFDRPFRGELGLRPDSYQLIYGQLWRLWRLAFSRLQVLSFGHPHVPALRHLAVPLPTRLWRRVHSNLVTPARSVIMHLPIVLCTGFIRCGSREQRNRDGDLERPSRGRMILLSVG